MKPVEAVDGLQGVVQSIYTSIRQVRLTYVAQDTGSKLNLKLGSLPPSPIHTETAYIHTYPARERQYIHTTSTKDINVTPQFTVSFLEDFPLSQNSISCS